MGVLYKIPRECFHDIAAALSECRVLRRKLHMLYGHFGFTNFDTPPKNEKSYNRIMKLLDSVWSRYGKDATWVFFISGLQELRLNGEADEVRTICSKANTNEELNITLCGHGVRLRPARTWTVLFGFLLGLIIFGPLLFMAGLRTCSGDPDTSNRLHRHRDPLNATTTYLPLPSAAINQPIPRNNAQHNGFQRLANIININDAFAKCALTKTVSTNSEQRPAVLLQQMQCARPSFLPTRSCNADWDFTLVLRPQINWAVMRKPQVCADTLGLRYMVTLTGSSSIKTLNNIMEKVGPVATSLNFSSLELAETTPLHAATCLPNSLPSVEMKELTKVNIVNMTAAGSQSQCIGELLSTNTFPKLKEIEIRELVIDESNSEFLRKIMFKAKSTLKVLKVGGNVGSALHPNLALVTDELCDNLQSDFTIEADCGAEWSNVVQNILRHKQCTGFLPECSLVATA